MATPRSLKRNLLNARDRLGESIISIVGRDVAEHGPEVITALRERNPAAYARLISDLVHFKKLKAERAPPRRKPRPMRAKNLAKAMRDGPIDPTSPMLPEKELDQFLDLTRKMRPKTPWSLTPEEVRAALGEPLAAWFEKQGRHGFAGTAGDPSETSS